jgi:transcriptional regulator GlxA family with amidase domain
VIFTLFPGCEILDFAGPLQTFHEAQGLGAAYEIVLSGTSESVDTAQGLRLCGLLPLPQVGAGDLVLVPGLQVDRTRLAPPLLAWLRRASRSGARLCSVCTGSFALGRAGLLDGRRCTTHWKRLAEMRREFPRARVVSDRLFVHDGPITTSAGIASGIDMALSLVDEHHGPVMAARVAREMVVYLRRQGGEAQQSVYLDFRTHLSSGVHEVQDHLVAHPEATDTLAQLARIGRMSPRTLTRTFRQATGASVLEFRTRVRLERARALLHDPGMTLEAIAERCGFADARQLRRLWKAAYGHPPRRRPARIQAGVVAPARAAARRRRSS